MSKSINPGRIRMLGIWEDNFPQCIITYSQQAPALPRSRLKLYKIRSAKYAVGSQPLNLNLAKIYRLC